MSFFFLPLEEDAIEIEGVFCCLAIVAIVAIALENVGELNEIPGTSENGKTYRAGRSRKSLKKISDKEK